MTDRLASGSTPEAVAKAATSPIVIDNIDQFPTPEDSTNPNTQGKRRGSKLKVIVGTLAFTVASATTAACAPAIARINNTPTDVPTPIPGLCQVNPAEGFQGGAAPAALKVNGADQPTPTPRECDPNGTPEVTYENASNLQKNLESALNMTPRQLQALTVTNFGKETSNFAAGSTGHGNMYRALFVDAAQVTVTTQVGGKTVSTQATDSFILLDPPGQKPFIVVVRQYTDNFTLGKLCVPDAVSPTDVMNTGGTGWVGGTVSMSQVVESLGNEKFDPNHLNVPTFDNNPNDADVYQLKRGTVIDIQVGAIDPTQNNAITALNATRDLMLDMEDGKISISDEVAQLHSKYGDKAPVVLTSGMTADEIKQAVGKSATNDSSEDPVPPITIITLRDMPTTNALPLYRSLYPNNAGTTKLVINGTKMDAGFAMG